MTTMQKDVKIMLALILGFMMVCSANAEIQIGGLRPTFYFFDTAGGKEVCQLATLSATGVNLSTKYHARVVAPGKEPCVFAVSGWRSKKGKNKWRKPDPNGIVFTDIRVPDIQKPCKIKIELLGGDARTVISSKTFDWTPGRKFTVYFICLSHHDLGFGNYPHRLRTSIRHANINRPLEYCRKTDSWDHDAQFRYQIETSEPLTSYIASQTPDVVEELAGRIREGRIQLGAIHSTANTEQLSHECMARQFYLANRHACDLLNVPPAKTALDNDLIGLTWPLTIYCQAADVDYFFHARNPNGRRPSCLQPAHLEPVFYWQGPDKESRVLVRHEPYGRRDVFSEARFERLIGEYVDLDRWPYDVLMMTDMQDYHLAQLDRAGAIRGWNARYAYPRVIMATMDMFFDAIAERKQQHSIRTFDGDANNEWASMESGDARLLAQIRYAGQLVPAAEKFSTIASTLTPGGYPWTDIYQAYHRLLNFYEHTDGAWNGKVNGKEGACYYETELEENREMGRDAEFLGRKAADSALTRLCSEITTKTDWTLVVFNQMERKRTDIVRTETDLKPGTFRLVDAGSGKTIEHQYIDGELVFAAADVPSLGYKTFRVESVKGKEKTSPLSLQDQPVIENRFYRIRFDRKRGGVVSIHDKQLDLELVDGATENQFGQYLYKIQDNYKAQWHRPEKPSFTCSKGPVATVMDIRSTVYGARDLRNRVTIYEDLKRIDFQVDIDKEPCGITLADFHAETTSNKESVFICMPFKVPDFTINHELPGAVAQPYRQQMKGSCTSYYAIRNFSDISNEKFGVTVSAPDSALVQYGHPRSFILNQATAHNLFERSQEYPKNSHMSLFLMNNLWDMNLQIDQPGRHRFRWSVRSHAGNWQTGKADQFGWDVNNPLMAKLIEGKREGSLPAAGSSFVRVQPGNVLCTTIKQAEHNGAGVILRLVETGGKATDAEVTLPFIGKIEEVRETNLVEKDKENTLAVKNGHGFKVSIQPFGVRTIRILSGTGSPVPAVAGIKAKPVSDMEISLSWQVSDQAMKNISHFNVYRSQKPDFKPTLLNLVQRSAVRSCTDRPILHYAGWINNRVEPDTVYYYRVEAVDRRNNRGPVSEAVSARTMKSSEKNMVPLKVEQLSAIHVSPLAPCTFVNLLFRTSCESDVAVYEIHRSTKSGFTPDDGTRIGEVRSDDIIPAKHPEISGYGTTNVDYPVKDFDHAMFKDMKVEPETAYFYKVRAVDTAGQKGEFSDPEMVKTK